MSLQNRLSNINFNPLGLDLNPLGIDFQNHRDRFVNFFQNGTEDLNTRMQNVVGRLRSNEYRKKMTSVLSKIKDTKEYQSTNNTDYDVIFESVDMYSNLQSDPTLDKDEIDVVTDLSSYKKRFAHWLKMERISTILFIPILGILIALMGLLCDFVLKELDAFRTMIMPNSHKMYDPIDGLVFVGYSVVMATISVCCISFISPYAVGSGIPEIKSILSGINLSRVLGYKTLLSKLLGMVCATAAGLTIGRTGPFMHASAIIAQQMMGSKFFSNIRKNQIVRYQMLICALAAGVVANFGAPIGGLLFSIEVTATNCLFGNLWKGFLCATTTAVIFYLTRPWMGGAAFSSVYHFDYVPQAFGLTQLATFVFIGIVTGLIGALFVFLYEKIVRFRLRYPILKQSRIGLVASIALVSALVNYLAGPLCRKPLSYAMKQFIGKTEPQPYLFPVDPTDEDDPHKFFNLLVFIGVKLFLTSINIVLPIPGGAITPFIVTGAALGRLFGELLHYHLNLKAIEAAGYAVIASAGLVSGTIRALSPSIFVLELTGQLSLLIPVLICSITASAVGNFFNRPLFDTALKIQNLPFLSSYRSEKVYTMTAKQVMRKDINFLSMRSNCRQLKDFLEKFKYSFIPIVDSNENMLLVGIVERSSLYYLLETHIEKIETLLDDYKQQQLSLSQQQQQQQQQQQNNTDINNINNNNNDENTIETIIIPNDKQNLEDDEEDEYNDNAQLLGNNSNNSSSSNNSDSFEMVKKQDQDLMKEIEDENKEHQPKIEEDEEEIDLDDNQEGIPLVNVDHESTLRKRNINNNNNDEGSSSNNNNNNNNNFEISMGSLENLKGENVWGDHILGDIINSGEVALLMDLAPSQIPDLTPLNKVFHLFTMLGLSFTYVTSLGKLVGVITKTDLIAKEL
ncbi:chloride channel protein [Tieghemostelium lacteum]|uniref:Chloride channel protein n=1 Tax=Tieghemostelium lacteum TaxID=361077 RepID=A0A151Z6U8_TIELA|nr:chloride channel protein [Tieghemostelium lacteum]|eukprot:KYQ89686.1 chloride channel protein [Tieghemostelium lacteum]